MTFRSGDLTRNASQLLTLQDLQEGQKIMGRVKRIETFGLFIEIDGSKVTGLCHKSQVCSHPMLHYGHLIAASPALR